MTSMAGPPSQTASDKHHGFDTNMRLLISKFLGWLALLVVTCGLAACALTGPRLVNHSFEFNAVWDSPEAEVLDYRYGESRFPGARPPEWALQSGQVAQGTGTSGHMLVGDSLYVKWRIKSTGEVFQDTVDLRSRLPADIKGQKIRFLIKGAQLHVYLIAEKNLDPNPCMLKGDPRALARLTNKADDIVFAMYCNRQITRIYPDQPKP